jgi:hypothetical protein
MWAIQHTTKVTFKMAVLEQEVKIHHIQNQDLYVNTLEDLQCLKSKINNTISIDGLLLALCTMRWLNATTFWMNVLPLSSG